MMDELGLSKLQFASIYTIASIIVFFLFLRRPVRKIRKQEKSSKARPVSTLQVRSNVTNDITEQELEEKLNALLDKVDAGLTAIEQNGSSDYDIIKPVYTSIFSDYLDIRPYAISNTLKEHIALFFYNYAQALANSGNAENYALAKESARGVLFVIEFSSLYVPKAQGLISRLGELMEAEYKTYDPALNENMHVNDIDYYKAEIERLNKELAEARNIIAELSSISRSEK